MWTWVGCGTRHPKHFPEKHSISTLTSQRWVSLLFFSLSLLWFHLIPFSLSPLMHFLRSLYEVLSEKETTQSWHTCPMLPSFPRRGLVLIPQLYSCSFAVREVYFLHFFTGSKRCLKALVVESVWESPAWSVCGNQTLSYLCTAWIPGNDVSLVLVPCIPKRVRVLDCSFKGFKQISPLCQIQTTDYSASWKQERQKKAHSESNGAGSLQKRLSSLICLGSEFDDLFLSQTA